MLTYTEKLKNPLWQRKRLEIFQRDHFACRNCGDTTKELQVHHLEYLGDLLPQDYPNDMLLTLCESCHKVETSRKNYENYLLTSLKMKGFLAQDVLRLSTKIDTDNFFATYLKNLLRKNL